MRQRGDHGGSHSSGWFSGSGGWLAAAIPSDDGVVIPARPSDRGCDLAIRADGVTLTAGWTAVTLPWREFRPWPGPLVLRPAAPERDSWCIAPFSTTQHDVPVGIGIEVTGRDVEATARVRALRNSWRNRLVRALQQGVVVPLAPEGAGERRFEGDRAVVAALCRVLAEHPEVRTRLDDPRRTRRLVQDMIRRPLREIVLVEPVARRAFEISSSLKRLGCVHRLGGRPLPGDPLPDEGELAERVQVDLQRNPYSRDLDISLSQIRQAIRERYLVEAWPFAALMR